MTTRNEFFKADEEVKLGTLYLRIAKWFIKRIPRDKRQLRCAFIGKALERKKYLWIHLTEHPWEHKTHAGE